MTLVMLHEVGDSPACISPMHSGILLGAKFRLVESTPPVRSNRDDPAQCEKSHNKIAECAEVVVERGHLVPEPSLEMAVAHPYAPNIKMLSVVSCRR